MLKSPTAAALKPRPPPANPASPQPPCRLPSVMDYAPGGTLLDYVQQRKRLREPLARWFFQQLVVAVDYWWGCLRGAKGDGNLGGGSSW
jgi:hypothetical protein